MSHPYENQNTFVINTFTYLPTRRSAGHLKK